MTIRKIRILPPLAFGRLGSGDPMDNYTVGDNPENPLDWRVLKPQPTFEVDDHSGRIVRSFTPKTVEFMTDGHIRPVAPFLEVFAETETGKLEPLTLDMLRHHKLDETAISWRVVVANRKVERRTGKKDDRVTAETKWIKNHVTHHLKGYCRNFISKEAFVDFGKVRYVAQRIGGVEILHHEAVFDLRAYMQKHDEVVLPRHVRALGIEVLGPAVARQLLLGKLRPHGRNTIEGSVFVRTGHTNGLPMVATVATNGEPSGQPTSFPGSDCASRPPKG